jgi:hypothetical protein
MAHLLAVDLGVKTGLALYEHPGRLVWYRSQNLGQVSRLRRAAHQLLREIDDLEWVVMEGGGPLADLWSHEAAKLGIGTHRTHAEQWRQRLMLPRDQRSGAQAKRNADELARRVIDWSAAAKPTSLRHDAAEAILVGLWGLLQVGWLDDLPRDLQP